MRRVNPARYHCFIEYNELEMDNSSKDSLAYIEHY
jgi:hypothetical protein